MNRANLGHTGEAVAAKYYIRQGYLLLNHNYRTRMGELDLIKQIPSCLPRSRPAPAPSAPPQPKRWTIINSNV